MEVTQKQVELEEIREELKLDSEREFQVKVDELLVELDRRMKELARAETTITKVDLENASLRQRNADLEAAAQLTAEKFNLAIRERDDAVEEAKLEAEAMVEEAQLKLDEERRAFHQEKTKIEVRVREQLQLGLDDQVKSVLADKDVLRHESEGQIQVLRVVRSSS